MVTSFCIIPREVHALIAPDAQYMPPVFSPTLVAEDALCDMPFSLYVWSVNLATLSPAVVPTLLHCLSGPERQRMQRYVRPELQQRYGLSRGVLRHVLGYHLSEPPAAIQFTYNAYQRPQLANGCHMQYDFNLSHAGDQVVYAVVSGPCKVGIDIEQLQERAALSRLVQYCFSVAEQQYWEQEKAERAVPAFYQGWVCKEAVIKAIGMGLSYPLKALQVSLDVTRPYRVLAIQPQYGPVAQWQLYPLQVASPFLGCVALYFPLRGKEM